MNINRALFEADGSESEKVPALYNSAEHNQKFRTDLSKEEKDEIIKRGSNLPTSSEAGFPKPFEVLEPEDELPEELNYPSTKNDVNYPHKDEDDEDYQWQKYLKGRKTDAIDDAFQLGDNLLNPSFRKDLENTEKEIGNIDLDPDDDDEYWQKLYKNSPDPNSLERVIIDNAANGVEEEEDDDEYDDTFINPATGEYFTKKELRRYLENVATNVKGRRSAGGKVRKEGDPNKKGRPRLTPAEKEERERARILRHEAWKFGRDSIGEKILAQDLKEPESKRHITNNAVTAVNTHAREYVTNFIKHTPQYSVTKYQIVLIQQAYREYQKAGNEECAKQCVQLIRQLKLNLIKYESVFKNHSKEEIDRTTTLIKKNPEIKNINVEIRKAKELLKQYSVSDIMKTLELYRIALYGKYSDNVVSKKTKKTKLDANGMLNLDPVEDDGFNTDFDDSGIESDEKIFSLDAEDFDDSEGDEKSIFNDPELYAERLKNAEIDGEINDSTNAKKPVFTEGEYLKHLTKIAQLTGLTIDDLEQMSNVEIRKSLKEVISPDLLGQIKDRILLLQRERSHRIKEIKGSEDLPDIMWNLFDYKDPKDIEKSKQLLGASHTAYVTAIAFKLCQKINRLNLFEDAVAYGLMALSECINKWLNVQTVAEESTSFEAFCYVTISNTIQKGLYTLTSGGKITGTNMATKVHNREKYVKAWMDMHPELANLPQDMLDEIASTHIDYISSMSTEKGYRDLRLPYTHVTATDLSATIGTESEVDDVWGLIQGESVDNELNTVEKEAQEYYGKLIESITDLFKLFKLKKNPVTGQMEPGTTKYFDKYDYWIFMYGYGFIKKKVKDEPDRMYTESEIAQIIADIKKADGATNSEPMSQANMSYRIKSIGNKLNNIMEERPEIKDGLSYLWNYWKSNFEELNKLSGEREIYNTKLDKVKLEDHLKLHPQKQQAIRNSSMASYLIDDIQYEVKLPSEIKKSIENLFYRDDI
jgi:hypothetical protein